MFTPMVYLNTANTRLTFQHPGIATIMNVYGNAMMESKREANSKVVQMALRQEVRKPRFAAVKTSDARKPMMTNFVAGVDLNDRPLGCECRQIFLSC
jgi:hypothetical protein